MRPPSVAPAGVTLRSLALVLLTDGLTHREVAAKFWRDAVAQSAPSRSGNCALVPRRPGTPRAWWACPACQRRHWCHLPACALGARPARKNSWSRCRGDCRRSIAPCRKLDRGPPGPANRRLGTLCREPGGELPVVRVARRPRGKSRRHRPGRVSARTSSRSHLHQLSWKATCAGGFWRSAPRLQPLGCGRDDHRSSSAPLS
jgi:hypothetical protein